MVKQAILAAAAFGDDAGDFGIGELDESPLDFANLLEKGRQPAGKKGFSVTFGPYGCFVGEFSPAQKAR